MNYSGREGFDGVLAFFQTMKIQYEVINSPRGESRRARFKQEEDWWIVEQYVAEDFHCRLGNRISFNLAVYEENQRPQIVTWRIDCSAPHYQYDFSDDEEPCILQVTYIDA